MIVLESFGFGYGNLWKKYKVSHREHVTAGSKATFKTNLTLKESHMAKVFILFMLNSFSTILKHVTLGTRRPNYFNKIYAQQFILVLQSHDAGRL